MRAATIRRWGSFPFRGFGPNELCVVVNRLYCPLYSMGEISLFGDSLVVKFGLPIYFSQGVVTPFPQLRQKKETGTSENKTRWNPSTPPFFLPKKKTATQHNR